MRGILSSKALWATDAREAKDKREVTYPFEIARPFVDERVNGRPRYLIKQIHPLDEIESELRGKFFIACLSEADNIPGQWKAYADEGRGCAIGFKLTHDCCGQQNIVGPFPMVYDDAAQRQMTRRFLELATNNWRKLQSPDDQTRLYSAAVIELLVLQISLKDPQLKDEREWRLLVAQKDQERYSVKTNEHRYVELPICTCETVHEVVIGPNSDLTECRVEQILVDAGLHGAQVRRSECQV